MFTAVHVKMNKIQIRPQINFRCKTISLGQGQYGHASKYLNEAMTHGNWLVLENCHLDIGLSLRLCVEYQRAIDTENFHDEFRLWCVTAPTSDFPISVLRQAVKFACNPPNNLKERITRHANYLTDDQHLRWSIALVTFHAVLQERRTFGAIGWNRTYSFADHSLRQAITCFKELVKTVDDPTTFDGITYLVTECIYGGLVVDQFDRILLRALFQQICCNSTDTFFDNASICIPAELTTDNWTKAVDMMPTHETKATDVGLHANSEFERGFHQCDYILSTLAQSVHAEIENSTVDSVKILCDDILNRLPTLLPVSSGESRETFELIRHREIKRFNLLLQCMRATLTELRQAIDGDIHMIENLHHIYRSLQANRIPSAWLPFMYRTLNSLATFVHDLIERVEFFRHWDSNRPPKIFWFAAFYNPEALVTGMQTTYAIANSIDLADVCVQCILPVENARIESILIEVSVRIALVHWLNICYTLVCCRCRVFISKVLAGIWN